MSLTPRRLAGSPHLWLGLLATLAFVLRALPLLRFGPWGVPVDYDEGVYSAAAQLLAAGALPYRDFVFVHPPGLLYFLAPLAALPGLSPSDVFALSRVVAAAVGGVNTWLVGHLASRWRGPVAGLLAALLYATYPEVLDVERGPFLEPLLNLTCLAAAALWLRAPAPSLRAAAAAGALLGWAFTVKLTGAIFVLAALASAPRADARRLSVALVLGAGVSALLLLAPLVFAAPTEFLTQTLRFHAWRPPDGVDSSLERLRQMFLGRHPIVGVLSIMGVLATLHGLLRERAARLALLAFGLTAAAFLTTRTYWSQYNAFLAPMQCLFAGVAGAVLVSRASAWGPRVRWAAVLLLTCTGVGLVRLAVLHARMHTRELVALGDFLRTHVPREACVLAFEPAWTLAAGRLPPADDTGRFMVDPYGAMLLGASREGRRHPDAGAAFVDSNAQAVLQPYVTRCGHLVLGGRGRWQLGEQGMADVQERFRPMAPAAESGVDVWKRAAAGP